MDVLDAELLGPLQILVGPGVGQLVAPTRASPLGSVKLDALQFIGFRHLIEFSQAGFLVPRIEAPVQDEAVRVRGLQQGVPLDGVEPLLVEVLEVCRLQDGHVVRAVYEQILHHLVGAVAVELLLRPDLLLRAERGVVAVEAVDELGAVNVLLVLGTAIPVMNMTIDDKDLFAVFGSEHAFLPYSFASLRAAWRSNPGASGTVFGAPGLPRPKRGSQ